MNKLKALFYSFEDGFQVHLLIDKRALALVTFLSSLCDVWITNVGFQYKFLAILLD